MAIKWVGETEAECKMVVKDLELEKSEKFKEKHLWFGKDIHTQVVEHVFGMESKIEKCAKCKKELGWQKMHCHEVINEWLCDICENDYSTNFEKFKKTFLNS